MCLARFFAAGCCCRCCSVAAASCPRDSEASIVSTNTTNTIDVETITAQRRDVKKLLTQLRLRRRQPPETATIFLVAADGSAMVVFDDSATVKEARTTTALSVSLQHRPVARKNVVLGCWLLRAAGCGCCSLPGKQLERHYSVLYRVKGGERNWR